eukprot:4173019-Pleurochrysis_carterae.AAC.3
MRGGAVSKAPFASVGKLSVNEMARAVLEADREGGESGCCLCVGKHLCPGAGRVPNEVGVA